MAAKDEADALNHSLENRFSHRHTYATYIEEHEVPIATSAAAAAVTSILKGMTIDKPDMESFYRSIMLEKPQPQNKKWTREYVGFESLNDTVEDLTEEAFTSVIPNGEFKGTVKITVEYIPDLTGECKHGFEFWWKHCPHCVTTSSSGT